MESVIKSIEGFFKKNEWNYSFVENDKVKIFSTSIEMNNVLGTVDVKIIVGSNSYNVYSVLNSKVESEYLDVMAKYLHEVNYGLKSGNFEMDYEDGEIRYKTYVNFQNIQLSEDVLEESILLGVFMIDIYGKDLLKIMLGKNDKCEDMNPID